MPSLVASGWERSAIRRGVIGSRTDLLELNGKDLRSQPFEQRKGELKVLLKPAPFSLALNDYVLATGRRYSRKPAALG